MWNHDRANWCNLKGWLLFNIIIFHTLLKNNHLIMNQIFIFCWGKYETFSCLCFDLIIHLTTMYHFPFINLSEIVLCIIIFVDLPLQSTKIKPQHNFIFYKSILYLKYFISNINFYWIVKQSNERTYLRQSYVVDPWKQTLFLLYSHPLVKSKSYPPRLLHKLCLPPPPPLPPGTSSIPRV